jgi:hypothetical protein
LVIDWGEIGPLYVFCAVLAWSRWRFVRFADNLRAETTFAALAACFEALGGVPATVLSDRMGCIKGATVAGVVVPTADYVRFANHYSFRPDFCHGQDPESKGRVENLVGYVKSDLMIPAELTVGDLAGANAAGVGWCVEVNAAWHSEICAVPAVRLAKEVELLRPLPSLRATIGKVVIRKVDRLCCVRFGSARYSVPLAHIGSQVEVRVADGRVQVISLGQIVADHAVVAPHPPRRTADPDCDWAHNPRSSGTGDSGWSAGVDSAYELAPINAVWERDEDVTDGDARRHV